MRVVLDASALLAFLYEETGQEQVAAVINSSIISSVNLSEVIAKLTKDGFPTEVIDKMLLELPLTVIPFDNER
jgi:ribonuclease VapC